MTARRALIRESDLRRWARISREEGVAIRGHVDATGVTISVNPIDPRADPDDDDFDHKMRAFLRK